MDKKMLQAYFLLLLATGIWGGNLVVGKVATAYFPPFTLALLRWSIALLILLPFSWRRLCKEWNIIVRYKWVLVGMSIFGISGYNALLYYALNHTTSINAAVVNSITPVFIAAFSFFILRQTLKIGQILGIAISVLGIVLTVSQGSWEKLIELRFNVGDLLVIAAVICWSIYSVLLKKYAVVLPRFSAFFFTVMLAVISLAGLSATERPDISVLFKWNGTVWFILLYIGIAAAIVSFLAWNVAIERVGAATAGIFYNLIPLFSISFAVIFLGEPVLWYQISGGTMVIAGVLVSVIPFSRNELTTKRILMVLRRNRGI
ncbi:DMT family transporter [Paenibacillus aestuarii]|uniref:DMT family transporter n=1 Tax=Paenibacillus aestuarii TaxID=516965 RepID=A0ABW0K6Y9_9BACL